MCIGKIKVQRSRYHDDLVDGSNIDDIEMNIRLQAVIPSAHVWFNFESLESPHLLNQAPPGAQQLEMPDSLLMEHFGHVRMTEGVCALTNFCCTAAFWALCFSGKLIKKVNVRWDYQKPKTNRS